MEIIDYAMELIIFNFNDTINSNLMIIKIHQFNLREI